MLVANKMDMEDVRVIDTKAGRELAQEMGAM